MTNTPFSYAFFSVLSPGAVIKPHSSPCNLRLRCHLPLRVPSASPTSPSPSSPPAAGAPVVVDSSNSNTKHGLVCGIRVGDEVRPWEEGRLLVFDDCFEHEVWNLSNEERVVLLFDLWHPDLSLDEQDAIEKMFKQARTNPNPQ
eukprot:c17077_g1_i1.p1 GENE.c17077_g1_i1~~c17077_g1_i1.p1  ORF type:complete len:144 (-),score=34.38 c17077_g1_i1:20-451(-)